MLIVNIHEADGNVKIVCKHSEGDYLSIDVFYICNFIMFRVKEN